jgi:hypothetical protein
MTSWLVSRPTHHSPFHPCSPTNYVVDQRRFSLLWDNDTIQKRLQTEWYKDVKQIDADLYHATTRLSATVAAGAAGLSGVSAILEEISRLAQRRQETKSIQKSADRITNRGPGAPRFYSEVIVERLQEVQRLVATDQPLQDGVDALINAVVNFDTTSAPSDVTATTAHAAATNGTNAGRGSGRVATSDGVAAALPAASAGPGPGTAQPHQSSASSFALAPPVSGFAATASGSNAAGGALLLPTQFSMRFTHVGNEAATVANPTHTGVVAARLEAGFAGAIASAGITAVHAAEGDLQIVRMIEGSVIVTFVAHLVQRGEGGVLHPSDVVSRVQAGLRQMSPAVLATHFPGLRLDREFTRAQELTSAQLAELIPRAPTADGLSGFAAENATLRAELGALIPSLRTDRDRLYTQNRKYRRVIDESGGDATAMIAQAAAVSAVDGSYEADDGGEHAAAADAHVYGPIHEDAHTYGPIGGGGGDVGDLASAVDSDEDDEGEMDERDYAEDGEYEDEPEDAEWWSKIAMPHPSPVVSIGSLGPARSTATDGEGDGKLPAHAIADGVKLRQGKSGLELDGEPLMLENPYITEADVHRLSLVQII